MTTTADPEMARPVIVFPVYRETPAPWESASLRQAMRVLSAHTMVLVTHPALDAAAYEALAREAGVSLRREDFDPAYFASLEGYNRLCLSTDFYERFERDYDYMLFCQPDVWIFRDELSDWCARGYDYIGAPWIQGNPSSPEQIRWKAVGNGGFSLRRIRFCLDTLRATGPLLAVGSWRALWRDRASGAIVRKFPIYVTQRRLLRAARSGHLYEDTVFSLQKYTALKAAIPSPDEALAFSFERHPALLYERTCHRLPFGCHAWQLPAHYAFWQTFIPAP